MSLRKKILRIKKFKSGRKLVCLTAYSKPFSKIFNEKKYYALVSAVKPPARYGVLKFNKNV